MTGSKLQKLIAQDVADWPSDQLLTWMAELIDASHSARSEMGTRRALELAPVLRDRPLTAAQRAMLEYFLGNAEKDLNALEKSAVDFWSTTHHEAPIRQFRLALLHARQADDLEPLRWSQIYTNLGNELSTVGRFVEALDMRGRALERGPFGMALGNQGMTFSWYAGLLYDDGHSSLLLTRAHDLLSEALKRPNELESGAAQQFRERRKHLAPYAADLSTELRTFSLGRTQAERRYREWCLAMRLFLNPLNDALVQSVAATDVFHLPNM